MNLSSLLRNTLSVVLAAFISSIAHADLRIFATVPEWGALAETLGGDKVTVYTATTGLQDPHRIQARPSLIAKARSANLLIATGAELEAGFDYQPLISKVSVNRELQIEIALYLPGFCCEALKIQRLS